MARLLAVLLPYVGATWPAATPCCSPIWLVKTHSLQQSYLGHINALLVSLQSCSEAEWFLQWMCNEFWLIWIHPARAHNVNNKLILLGWVWFVSLSRQKCHLLVPSCIPPLFLSITDTALFLLPDRCRPFKICTPKLFPKPIGMCSSQASWWIKAMPVQ